MKSLGGLPFQHLRRVFSGFYYQDIGLACLLLAVCQGPRPPHEAVPQLASGSCNKKQIYEHGIVHGLVQVTHVQKMSCFQALSKSRLLSVNIQQPAAV